MATKSNGIVLFEGSSHIDGKPIVVIAILKSSNRKTGNMIQTFILRQDIDPVQASKLGEDVSICGNCPHRGLNGKARSCYVNLGQGPLSVWRAYKRGRYEKFSPVNPNWKLLVAGRVVRLGAYGDPAAVSLPFWKAVLSGAKGWTGYTHQWRKRPELRELVMASCDSPADYRDAQESGWRTFRVRLDSQELLANEITCPASAESGFRTSCEACKLCSGNRLQAKSIAIVLHGGIAVESNARKLITKLGGIQ
jgi:hypothetical protein